MVVKPAMARQMPAELHGKPKGSGSNPGEPTQVALDVSQHLVAVASPVSRGDPDPAGEAPRPEQPDRRFAAGP